MIVLHGFDFEMQPISIPILTCVDLAGNKLLKWLTVYPIENTDPKSARHALWSIDCTSSGSLSSSSPFAKPKPFMLRLCSCQSAMAQCVWDHRNLQQILLPCSVLRAAFKSGRNMMKVLLPALIPMTRSLSLLGTQRTGCSDLTLPCACPL